MSYDEKLSLMNAEPGVLSAIDRWRDWLIHERRCSRHTIDGYGHDLGFFFLS